ncbi:MAG: hypothetical protein LV479_10720 [Methylacidiphilales bacterium]|nr:hypothetical protein [Candidatus Methylacidiphilales bacterium]
MKFLSLFPLLILICPLLHAGVANSATYSVTANIVDQGGLRSASAAYANNGSVGEIVALSTVASPSETVKSGYIGQLYEPTALSVTAITQTLNGGSTAQLSAQELLDDLTYLSITSNLVTWSIAGPDEASINASGLFTAYNPSQTVSVNAQAVYQNFNSSLPFTIIGSGAPATFSQWEAEYFSAAQMANSTISGATAIPQTDGISNLLRYFLDISPTHLLTATDRAAMPFLAVSNGLNSATLTYRQFSLESGLVINIQTSLDLVTWQTISNPNIVRIGTDSNTGDPIMQFQSTPTGTRQFYRLSLSLP